MLGGAGWRRKSVSSVVISRAIHLFTQSLAVMGGAQKVHIRRNKPEQISFCRWHMVFRMFMKNTGNNH